MQHIQTALLLTGLFIAPSAFAVHYCECHGHFGAKSLWLYSSKIGGWRQLADGLTTQQCVEALRYPPCIEPKPDSELATAQQSVSLLRH